MEVPLSSTPLPEKSDPTDAVIFVGVSLVIGAACRQLLAGSKVPYTVALLILGIALGSLEYGTGHQLGKIGDGIRIWADIDPDLLLAVFLPALLFESSLSMEIHQIKRCMMQIFLVAGPGVLMTTFCLGSALKVVFPYNWSWNTCLLLGGLLSATDPVAVVAHLKELGASKKLSTIIEGESLMNDGIAVVVYQLFLRLVLGWSFNWGSIITYFLQVSLGAVGIGIAFGIAFLLWLRFVFSDTVIEITLTVAVSYIAYYAAQQGADVSGILTVMTLGIFYSAFARTAFKGESQEALHKFWEMVAYIANTLVFILSGVVIAEGVLRSDNIFKHHEYPWGYLLLLYIFVQVARFLVVGVLFPLLRYFGYGMDWKEAIILVWSGLRGAVSLSLSLSVMFLFFTSGIVFLTMIINGSTTQFLLHVLNMDKLSPAKRRILMFTKYEMQTKARIAFGDLGDDEELGHADWPSVKKYITSLNGLDDETVRPHNSAENDEILDHKNLKDIRIRFLNGVQAAYWGMLEEGRITQTIAMSLMHSVDEGIDLVSREPLCDWINLRSYVSIPSYYKFLPTIIIPQKLMTYLSVERLQSACYICAAFLRAHRIARQQLHNFIGENEIASMVIRESEEEGEEARKFLDDVRVTFPQVIRVVKIRQTTYAVLNHLIDYVLNLEKIGLLEKKEMIHLHVSVQTDLKKLLRNPPLVKVPKVQELISSTPLLGALPSAVREPIIGSTKETMKLHGATLYREGSRPTGIWLISNGVIKGITANHLVHPTFSHGSTLGLYEVLVGKPYICDTVANSAALCFFIESNIILKSLSKDPAVEEFFWQESAIVLAKLLQPQVFKKMAMQDMRALVAEWSTMHNNLMGETFVLPRFAVGFLLEGSLKRQGDNEELINSPAALLPQDGDQSSQQLKTSVRQELSYHVETRARVILFDIVGFNATRTLQRGSSSIPSTSADLPSGPFVSEYLGLMSWPENFHKQQQHPGLEGTDQQKMSLSARAAQLSIFGSSMSNEQWRPGSFCHNTGPKLSRSESFPRVTSHYAQRLVCVRSEGSSVHEMSSIAQQGRTVVDHIPQVEDLGCKRRDQRAESGDEGEHIVSIGSLCEPSSSQPS